MNASDHKAFILTPVSRIIEDTGKACQSLGDGIEIHPLASYIMQTTFLRITGASEQKLKCICWEIASFDYEFRYEMLRSPLGECSSYRDKQSIFKSICESLKRFEVSLEISEIDKDDIIDTSTEGLKRIIEVSPLSLIFEREFSDFRKYCSLSPIGRTSFCNIDRNHNISFVEGELKEYYSETVYRQRNRYAHNLSSYQLNLPTFTKLATMDSNKQNHFRMFSSLILIDKIFMTLFNKFSLMKTRHIY